MPAHKKDQEEKLQPVIGAMKFDMIGKLDTIAIDNDMSRNAVIRLACEYIITNKSKFKLK